MRKIFLAAAALSVAVPVIPAAAVAHDRHERHASDYDRDGYYHGPAWRGRDGRMYCRRSDGTTGLIVGAAAGALVGRAVDTRGERATGTILGAAAGALLGREVAKKRRCR